MKVMKHWNRLPREVMNALLPGGDLGQAEWGTEQPGQEGDDLAHVRRVGTR